MDESSAWISKRSFLFVKYPNHIALTMQAVVISSTTLREPNIACRKAANITAEGNKRADGAYTLRRPVNDSPLLFLLFGKQGSVRQIDDGA